MKVAFATQDLQHVDAHFGWARTIVIHDVSADGHRFLEAVQFAGELQEDGNEDKLTPKIEAIADCALLYVAAIGGSAAARVVARSIHPVRLPQATGINEILDRLQVVLQGTPPPWLRKAAMKGQARGLAFADEEFTHG